MNNPILPHDRQRVADREAQKVETFQAIERERRDGRVTVKPFSIWMLAGWGLAFFLAGFFSARPGSNFTATTVDLSNPPSQSTPLAVPTSAAPASAVRSTTADANAPVVAHVAMKNMKFSPATIEIKKGDTVEWTNDDITPHTATALPSFDSGSVASAKTWSHTFTKAGSFPYGCTFHPEMKGVVVVK
ncbi:MAG: cupredoxin family copper-binding protein [Chthoniobacterales bacterium]